MVDTIRYDTGQVYKCKLKQGAVFCNGEFTGWYAKDKRALRKILKDVSQGRKNLFV